MRIASIGYIVERFALKQVICCQNRQRFSANHLDKVASSSIYAVFRNKIYQMQQSSSVWGCGLKYRCWFPMQPPERSSSVWGCGLKSVRYIEHYGRGGSSSVWGCGLKSNTALWRKLTPVRHPPCEDVDWNPVHFGNLSISSSHPPCEDVDWNCNPLFHGFAGLLSSSVWGCGLKLQGIEQKQRGSEVILRVRMWIEMRRTG